MKQAIPDFHEDDEDPQAIRAAFDAGVHGVTAHPALHVSDPHRRVLQANLDAAQDEIERLWDNLAQRDDEIQRLTRQRDDARRMAITAGVFESDCECIFTTHESGICQALTDEEMIAAGVVTDHTVGCAGDLCETCEAIRPSICPACSAGDHSRHRADFAGVCIGCACVVAS